MIKKEDLYFVLFSVIALFCIGFFLTIPATPSDPLQYISPALSPQDGFVFLDRIFLWLWIRLFALLPLNVEYVGGYATLAHSIIAYLVSALWLIFRFGRISLICFSLLYFLSTAWLSILTYTYPMQGLTMFIILSLVFFDFIKGDKSYFALGAGFTLAIFSKIQGFGFISGFFYTTYISLKLKSFKPIYFWTLGFFVIFILLYLFLLVDGNSMLSLVKSYLQSNNMQQQFNGRGLGGLPPFYELLSKLPYILSLFGLLYGLSFFNKKPEIFLVSYIGFSQLVFVILIYYITQRGGPVIENYFLDSYTLGIISFSAIFSKFKVSSNSISHYFYLIPALPILSLVFYAYYLSYA